MKISELAKELKPYIVKWINESSGGTISGVANGNFAPTPHSISGYHHSGTLPHSSTWMSGLADDTHIQYASADGSGTRSGYQSERLNKSILSGSGITGGGLLTANQTLTLRTPATNLAASSTNVVNANGHTHAIDAKSDVSATNTADLLKSTASGGLTLKTLDVMGAVDILGGDLTVGSAMTLFVDESGNNVGVAGAPDPQFALDVNGPFHADAIYGPLGRILKDCIFLAHFDGPPGPDDYSGTPQTVQGELPTTSSATVYRPGKFNKGFQSAYATTNKMTNPIFDNPTDWDANWYTNGTDLAIVQNTNPIWVYAGHNSARLIRSVGDGGRVFYQSINVASTATHCLSAYVKRQDGGSISASDLFLYYNVPLDTTTTYTYVGNGWYLLEAVVTGIASLVAVGVAVEAFSETYYIGGVQIEEYAYPTPLAHGDMVVGHSWASTPHGSWTTRTVSKLLYSHRLDWVASDFSIGFWIQPWLDQVENTTTNWAFCWAYDADNYIGMIYSTSGIVMRWEAANVIQTIGTLTGITRGAWYHVAFVKEGTTLTGYVNGESVGSITIGSMEGVPSTLGIGSYYSGANPFTGIIDDFYVVTRAQTADDIGAIIDSEVPVVAEVGAMSWYSGGTTPIWVDSDGFWMRDHTGLEVFGWSSVDNKSWGGVTMDAGDNLIGRYGSGSGGWMRWDRSAGQLKLGYSDACSMAFDGSGACIVGKLQMPGASAAIAVGSTPPTASNAGTGIWIDRGGLTSLASNASQIRINATDGKLYAGAGKVVISNEGIQLTAGTVIDPNASIQWYQSGSYAAYMGMFGAADTWLDIVNQSKVSNEGAATRLYVASEDGLAIAQFALSAKHPIYDSTAAMAYFSVDYIKVLGGDIRVGGGLYVGNAENNPPADDIIADGGIYLGRNADPGVGNVAYAGVLKSYKNATEYTAYAFVPLTTPLTSASWDGDSRSSSPKTLIDLSAVFGAPAGIKAVLLSVQVRDSTSSTGDAFIIFSDDNTAGEGIVVGCNGIRNDAWAYNQAIVPCDANGDIYYQTVSTGVLTLDIVVKIIGYWI